jgi:ATP-dependent RNA helicase DDX41
MEEHDRRRREKEASGVTREEDIMKEEAEIMARIRADKALKSVQELAKGVAYTESMESSWKVPRAIAAMGAEAHEAVRKKFHISIEGSNCPPPIPTFEHMKVHPAIVRMLADKGITQPTPIQMQALPLLMTGRDMVGVAYTGSGKTLTFSLPLIMFALEQQKKMPFMKNEVRPLCC